MSELAPTINNKPLPPVGFGTWEMGSNVVWNPDGTKSGHGWEPDDTPDRERRDRQCIMAIRAAVQRGLGFINGAEIYAGGRTDELIGRALAGLTVEVADTVITSSKLTEASADNPAQLSATVNAIKGRFGGRLDLLYIAHWPGKRGATDIGENIKIVHELDPNIALGVSNFTLHQLVDAQNKAEAIGTRITAIENRYSISRPYDSYHPTLQPQTWQPSFSDPEMAAYCKAKGIIRVAYTPFTKGQDLENPVVDFIAHERRITRAAVVIGWFLNQGIIPIPKSLNADHIQGMGQAMRLMQQAPLNDGEMRLLAAVGARKAKFM